jgi:Protein of unknown function (DUF2975)
MKRPTTLILKLTIILMGFLVLAFCSFVLPVGIRAEDADGYRPILIGLYAPAIPFFFALYQTMKLLGNIDKNKAFSDESVQVLKKIKYCAITISVLFAAGMPFIFNAADKDDAPGVVLLGLIFTFAPVVVATFAAVLQKLIQNAVDLKSENDLTV